MHSHAESMQIQKMTSQQTKIYIKKKQVPDEPNHLKQASFFFFFFL